MKKMDQATEVFSDATQVMSSFIARNKREIVKDVVIVGCVGGIIYFAFKGELFKAAVCTAGALLSELAVDAGFEIANKSIDVVKTWNAKTQTVIACNAETC